MQASALSSANYAKCSASAGLPLREALRQLEAEQLVTLQTETVAQSSPNHCRGSGQIYEIRAVLEGYAARLFTRRASPAEVQNLRQTVRDLKKAERDSPSELLLDRRTSSTKSC